MFVALEIETWIEIIRANHLFRSFRYEFWFFFQIVHKMECMRMVINRLTFMDTSMSMCLISDLLINLNHVKRLEFQQFELELGINRRLSTRNAE